MNNPYLAKQDEIESLYTVCVDCKVPKKSDRFKKCIHCQERDDCYRERAIQENLSCTEDCDHEEPSA